MTIRPTTDARPNLAPHCCDWRIGGVLALALTVRLAIAALGCAFAQGGPLVREPDSPSYIRAAEALVETGRFGKSGEPELVRAPGYSLLLTVGVWLGRVDAATIALQIGLGCLTAWLLYRIGLVVFERADCALAAALLYACEPLSALYASKLLSETLFTTTIAAAMLFALRFIRGQATLDLCLSAALVAGAAFVRPIAYFLPFALAALYVFWLWKGSESKQRLLLQTLAFVCLAFGPLVVWQARNYAVAGYPRFSAISDINLYFYQAAGALSAEREAPVREVQRELGYGDERAYLRLHPEQRSWSQAERLEFLHDEAVSIIREHPGAMLRAHLAGIRDMLTDPGTNAYLHFFRIDESQKRPQPRGGDASIWSRLRRAFREKPRTATVHTSLSAILFGYYALAIWGAICCRFWRNARLAFVLAVGCYLLALSGGPAAYHRFRLPLVPVVCLLAGCGLAALWSSRKRAPCVAAPNNPSEVQASLG
ncbi:MAG TPA: glycosyltransferase family 39 protein [Pirellulales bacterium]|nr:glycosyltransferase family 39 protein [Pirellulales bacterium]